MKDSSEKPFAAYSGREPYVFVCYSHADAGPVYSDLTLLRSEGVNIWYDEGISPGLAWRAEIAGAIRNASKFLFFISEASIESTHCLREVHFALDNDIEVIPVYLTDCTLPLELQLVLSRIQALFRGSDSMYMQHLLKALHGGSGEPSQPTSRAAAVAPRRRRLLPVVALACLLVALCALWFLVPGTHQQSDPQAVAKPSAFDPYLEGQQLLLRWDSDDNLNEAIDLFRKAVDIDPDFALAFARLAESLRIKNVITGDDALLEEAASVANSAAAINPDLAPVQVALGSVQSTRGNLDIAHAAFQRALEIDPNDIEANVGMAKLYQQQGRADDAEQAFARALALDPDNLRTLDSYANFLSLNGKEQKAIQLWQRAIRIAPDYYPALVNLGATLQDTGRLAEAIEVYEQSIRIRPSYMGYINLGTAYAHLRRYDQAIGAYTRALEFDPDYWLAWGNLAYVYKWEGAPASQVAQTFRRAIERAEEARQQSPRDPYVYSDLALYYAQTDQPGLAIDRLNTATALAADSADVWAAAAEVYEVLGQRAEALLQLQKAVDLGLPIQQLQRNPELAGLLQASNAAALR